MPVMSVIFKAAVLAVCASAAAGLLRPAVARAETAAEIEARQTQSRAEYDRIAKELSLTDERLDKLAADIAAVKKDHATIPRR